MSHDRRCVWKGIISHDRVAYSSRGVEGEQLACEACRGYNEACSAYMSKGEHDRGFRHPHPRDLWQTIEEQKEEE